MPKALSELEKRQRETDALAVLRDAGDDVRTVTELNTRIGAAFGGSPRVGEHVLLAALKGLPPNDALRQKYAAIKERYNSSARSAAGRLATASSSGKSLDVARQERTAYRDARRGLPSTRATAQRLLREINVATKATAVSLKDVIQAQVDCACVSGIHKAVDSFETAVAVAGSVRAVSVAPNGFCLIRKDLVKYAGQRCDAFVDEQAANFRKEDANERAYLDATRPAAKETFPSPYLMASAIQAAGIPYQERDLQKAGRDVLEPLYVQAQAVLAERKSSRPSRGAKKKGDEARHATAADSYAGGGAVLRPPVALAQEPGHFVRARFAGAEEDRAEDIEKIADALELEHKFQCSARAVVYLERASDDYGRLVPSPLDVGADLQLAKILVRLKSGRFMIAAVRANGEPIILVVGRGFIMDMFVGIRGPPIEAADAATRLRSSTGPGDAGSHKNYLHYRRGATNAVAALRRVIVQMNLSGGDVAALVDRVMEQIDGRCEELATGEAPTRGGTVPVCDSEDEGLGECPTGVDAADWATLKKGTEAHTFARLALASDFAAAASGLLGNLRGGAPGDKCGGDASDPVAVPTGGEAPPADDDAAELPGGSKRTSKKDKFARGQEADADRFLDWKKFGPLDFDWALKANVKGTPAWAKPIKKGERLVDFWLRFSRGAAASIDQKYVVLHSSDAAPADVPCLVEAVDKHAAMRAAAKAGGEPAAKRARTVPV